MQIGNAASFEMSKAIDLDGFTKKQIKENRRTYGTIEYVANFGQQIGIDCGAGRFAVVDRSDVQIED